MSKLSFERRIRRNMYSWHRVFGILTVLPVIFWTISGLGHPIIAHWFKTPVAHEYVQPKPLNTKMLIKNLPQVLLVHELGMIKNFRLVGWSGKMYYQVKDTKENIRYFSAADGRELKDGDRQYACYLARYFLGDAVSSIADVEKITSFTDQYQYVNRLLPVWKISFKRKDKMDVYVETSQSRLANYNDSNRKIFIWLFSNFHSYAFLSKITNNTFRYVVVLFLAAIVLVSTLSGLLIYGLLWNKFKAPSSGQQVGFLRRNHRVIGIATSLVTLTFMGSGAYHATRKFTVDDRINYVFEPEISIRDLQVNWEVLPVNWTAVSNVSLARFNGNTYYVLHTFNGSGGSWRLPQVARAEKGIRQEQQKQAAEPQYFSSRSGELLSAGVRAHSCSLVSRFVAQGSGTTGAPASLKVSSSAYMDGFDTDYGFVNKRLPVVKIALVSPAHLTYYLEPETGRMAARIQDSDRTEGLSFAIFHKFLLVDFAGKNFRDFVTAFAAMGVLVVCLLGLVLFIKTS